MALGAAAQIGVGAAGSGLDLVGGLISSAVGAKHQKAAQQRAKEDLKHVLKNRIQWQVEDLKAAGLNPILAAQSLGAGGGAGAAPMAPFPSPMRLDPVGSAAKMAKLSPERKLIEKQGDVATAQAALLYTDREKSKAAANLMLSQSAREWAEADRAVALEAYTRLETEMLGYHRTAAKEMQRADEMYPAWRRMKRLSELFSPFPTRIGGKR